MMGRECKKTPCQHMRPWLGLVALENQVLNLSMGQQHARVSWTFSLPQVSEGKVMFLSGNRGSSVSKAQRGFGLSAGLAI